MAYIGPDLTSTIRGLNKVLSHQMFVNLDS